MKFYFIFFVIPSLFGLTRLPDEFTVVERFFSLTDVFDIRTEFEPFATVRKNIFSFSPSFILQDHEGNSLASANARFFAWGTVTDVYDAKECQIGKIEEIIWRVFPWAEYKLFDANDRLCAIAKMNFLGTHFDLFPPENPEEIYATIERPLLHIFRDHWTVQIRNASIFKEQKIHPHLLIMLAVFQTDKDNRDRLRREIIEHFRLEQEQYKGT